MKQTIVKLLLIVCFYLLLQMIKVFVVDLCRLLEYEVTESTSLSEVQQWVARDSGVLVDDQRPLLPRGQPPDPTRPAIQCWAPPVSSWIFLCFVLYILDSVCIYLMCVGLFLCHVTFLWTWRSVIYMLCSYLLLI